VRGEPLWYAEAAHRAFDPQALTIGFARRVAAYKRLSVLIRDPERVLWLLRGWPPVQMVMAGKAHPHDDEGKAILRQVFVLKKEPGMADRVAFLEDYDLHVARQMVWGCDVWLNLPRVPLEASGTSGMKAALNGALNLSVLDGWWDEAFDGTNGWGIESDPGLDPAQQDDHDAAALYETLQRDVIPMFNDRDEQGIPREWLACVKSSLKSIGPRFGAGRMLGDYLGSMYAVASTEAARTV